VDVVTFAQKWGIKSIYINGYDLKQKSDKVSLSSLSFDLIWVSGWQRLIPDWLIDLAPLGALGVHGSPDGIIGGRGRSPQNWAIILGSQHFDLALFRITPGVDDGPIVSERSFFYNETDDIAISYKKVALCSGEMMSEVLRNPSLLQQAIPQIGNEFYFPQRNPEDGYVDWNLSSREICAHCRALTRPYPGLMTKLKEWGDVIIWKCQPFDDQVNNQPGVIDFVFEDGCFLVQTKDGRVIVSEYEKTEAQCLQQNDIFESRCHKQTLLNIIDRHRKKMPNCKLSKRLLNL